MTVQQDRFFLKERRSVALVIWGLKISYAIKSKLAGKLFSDFSRVWGAVCVCKKKKKTGNGKQMPFKNSTWPVNGDGDGDLNISFERTPFPPTFALTSLFGVAHLDYTQRPEKSKSRKRRESKQ